MPQNIFKIHDGRTNFWQWDRKQKLIVLDEAVTEVHFSNRNMTHSVKRDVYVKDGLRVCNVPDDLLKIPRNLVAYAYADGATVKSVKFAVVRRPMPSDYISDQSEELYEIERRLELLEAMLKDVEQGTQELKKFDNIVDASQWVNESGNPGDIIVIKFDAGWVPHVVEDDKSLSPICNCDGEEIILNFDGDDADGIQPDEIDDNTVIYYFDGGSASGIL